MNRILLHLDQNINILFLFSELDHSSEVAIGPGLYGFDYWTNWLWRSVEFLEMVLAFILTWLLDVVLLVWWPRPGGAIGPILCVASLLRLSSLPDVGVAWIAGWVADFPTHKNIVWESPKHDAHQDSTNQYNLPTNAHLMYAIQGQPSTVPAKLPVLQPEEMFLEQQACNSVLDQINV